MRRARPKAKAVAAQTDYSIQLSGANASGNDVPIGLELISEIGHGHAERLRIVVGAMAGALLRAKRAGNVLRKRRNRSVAIDGLGHVDGPVCPTIGGPIRASWLHSSNIIGVAREAGS